MGATFTLLVKKFVLLQVNSREIAPCGVKGAFGGMGLKLCGFSSEKIVKPVMNGGGPMRVSDLAYGKNDPKNGMKVL